MKLDDYVNERLTKENVSHEEFWRGYEDFKIGAYLKEMRKENGLTQSEMAKKINTTSSVISRMENHAEDIKLSTIEKFAEALGKKVELRIV